MPSGRINDIRPDVVSEPANSGVSSAPATSGTQVLPILTRVSGDRQSIPEVGFGASGQVE